MPRSLQSGRANVSMPGAEANGPEPTPAPGPLPVVGLAIALPGLLPSFQASQDNKESPSLPHGDPLKMLP